MTKFRYNTAMVCSQYMDITVENDTIHEVAVCGGCPGNLIGLSNLVKGAKINDIIGKLQGIRCGDKPTSCPDQLAHALKLYLKNQESQKQQ